MKNIYRAISTEIRCLPQNKYIMDAEEYLEELHFGDVALAIGASKDRVKPPFQRLLLSELLEMYHQAKSKEEYIEACKMIPEDYEEHEFALIHIDYLHSMLMKSAGVEKGGEK